MSLIAFSSQIGFGQNIQISDDLYGHVVVTPKFEGGIREFYKYIRENLKYPKAAKRKGIG